MAMGNSLRLTLSQHRCLEAMDIQIWKRRESEGSSSGQAQTGQSQENPAQNHPPAGNPVAPALVNTGNKPDDRDDRWKKLQAAVSRCTQCRLSESRTQTVFGAGNPDAELMIVGEAPGSEEDRLGEPFVGRSGQLLNEMLAAVKLQRSDIFIVNILKCRPPENRDPRPDEAAACADFLHRQVECVQPRLLMAVGRIAAQNLLGLTSTLGSMRGQVYSYGRTEVPLIVTYHPAYLLRSPSQKRKSWQDLCLARSILQDTGDRHQ